MHYAYQSPHRDRSTSMCVYCKTLFTLNFLSRLPTEHAEHSRWFVHCYVLEKKNKKKEEKTHLVVHDCDQTGY